MSSDRIEKLAKEYAARVSLANPEMPGAFQSWTDHLTKLAQQIALMSFRAGAAAGMAEHATTRRDTTEATP